MRRLVPWLLLPVLMATAAAAPIRVGVFTGVAQGRYWHTASHTAATAISSILANPASANLGPDLVVSAQGFVFTRHGVQGSAQCDGFGCSPTADQKAAFIGALDTTDVMVFLSNTEIGAIFPNAAHRARILEFSRAKGIVSLHFTTDSYASWQAWDSLHGARFQNHPNVDRLATIRFDSIGGAQADASWWFLNRGLPSSARIFEEWISFTVDGEAIRAVPGLKVLVNIDESSYSGGLGGARAMGDHPMSWYREFPEGGRFFYTALGHRAQTYQGTATSGMTTQDAFFLRRQIYNAILWAAGGDSTGVVSVPGGTAGYRSKFADLARVSFSGSILAVSVLHDGPHAVEVRSLDGRRVLARRGAGRSEHAFAGLAPGIHFVAVTTPAGRQTRKVMVK